MSFLRDVKMTRNERIPCSSPRVVDSVPDCGKVEPVIIMFVLTMFD